MNARRCECSDPSCPAHKDSRTCSNIRSMIFYRIDMEDRTDVAFCDNCADDAFKRVEEAMKNAHENQIGWIVTADSWLVLSCDDCRSPDESVPVYHVNVWPYRGTCDRCGKTLVEPKTPSWPELFGRRIALKAYK